MDKVIPPRYLNDDVPFAITKSIDLEIPPDYCGRVDDFIDDGIIIVPDTHDNRNRAIQAMLLAIHILFRPVDIQEKIIGRIASPWGNYKEKVSCQKFQSY
ncbi:MAG: hypothetical protein ACK53Y_10785 [bacterium]